MKYIFFIFSFFYITLLLAQQESKDVKVVQDSVKQDEKGLFIADYNNQLNIKLELSNEIKDYNLPLEQGVVELAPNLGIRYALVFNYRFLSLSAGFRSKPPKEDKEAKGESDLFELGVTFLFDKWSHRFVFSRVKGYYVKNSSDFYPIFPQGDQFLQLPDLTTYLFAGTSAYKFNDNFSIKATQSQTEVQLKSAGSFIPSADYWIYMFNGADKIIDGEGTEIIRTSHSDYIGFSVVFNIGYNYTFVYKKWFATIFAIPGIGVDYFKQTTYFQDNTVKSNQANALFSIQSGAGLGYNSNKYHFGVTYKNRFTNDFGNENNLQIQTLKNSFFIYFGYRFKAPKQISKPVDYIEKKVPILKDDKS